MSAVRFRSKAYHQIDAIIFLNGNVACYIGTVKVENTKCIFIHSVKRGPDNNCTVICIFKNTGGDGINIYAGNNSTPEVLISNSLIHNNLGYGIYARAYQGSTILSLTVDQNEISLNNNNGIYLYSDGGSGDPIISADITNNSIHDNRTYEIYIYTVSGAESDIEIDNNRLYCIV